MINRIYINFDALKGVINCLSIITVCLLLSTSISCKKESEVSIKIDTLSVSLENRNAIKKIDFLVCATILNIETGKYEITDADLKINYDSFKYVGHIEPGVNSIPLRESVDNYNIDVYKEGYITFSTTMRKNEIEKYLEKPFIIVLYSNK